MELQRINVKLFTGAPATIPLDPFIDIFGRWREDSGHPSGWIDLADYAHVPKGPGVMLIGKQGNLAIDLGDPGPGILYANKCDLSGTPEDRLLETFRRCLGLAAALTSESGYPQQLSPRPGSWELSFNDRLETPNTDDTDRRLRPAVESAVKRLFGPTATWVREADSGRRYGFLVHADETISLETVASRVRVDSLR